MLGFLTTILENAAKQLSVKDFWGAGKDVAEWRDNRHIASIGVNMFKLYVAAEEIVEQGFGIIPRLEWMARKHREQVFVNGYIAPTLEAQVPKVKEEIRSQITRIFAFSDLYNRLQSTVAAVDHESARKLYTLSAGKANLLSILTGSNRPNNVAEGLYVGLDMPAIETAIKQELENFSGGGLDMIAHLRGGDAEDAIISPITTLDVPWPKPTFEVIQQYLTAGLPRRRLEALHQSAVYFRESIEKHFDLRLVMLAIERQRIRPTAADTPTYPP